MDYRALQRRCKQLALHPCNGKIDALRALVEGAGAAETRREVMLYVPDIDRQILLHVDGLTLQAMCLSCTYVRQICNETFWRSKMEAKYGVCVSESNGRVYWKLYNSSSMTQSLLVAISFGDFALVESVCRLKKCKKLAYSEAIAMAIAQRGDVEILEYLASKQHDYAVGILAFTTKMGEFQHREMLVHLSQRHATNTVLFTAIGMFVAYADEIWRNAAAGAIKAGNVAFFGECVNKITNKSLVGELILISIESNSVEATELLLSIDGAVDAALANKAARYAVYIQHGALTELIMAKRAVDKEALLQLAAATGNLEFVRRLIEEGVDVHAHGDAAARYAAYHGRLDTLVLLADSGADLRASNDFAMRHAAREQHGDVVDYLKSRGIPYKVAKRPVDSPLIEQMVSVDMSFIFN